VRLELTVKDNIALITMDDGKVNAMDIQWFREMHALLDEVEEKGYAGLIIKGRPGVYSGGLNIKWLPEMTGEEARLFRKLFPTTMERIHHLPIPTIAALTGHAIAGGCIVACGCDWRVAIEGDYRLQMNEVRVNMTLPDWAIKIVEYTIPRPWVNYVNGYGEPLSFQKAHEIGVITGLAEDDQELMQLVFAQAEANSVVSKNDFAVTKEKLKR